MVLAILLTQGACGKTELTDGRYTVEATLKGGSGRATIEKAWVELQGETVTACITWSSPYYDFMIVDGVRYEPVNESGNSVFEFPAVLDEDMPVSADTVAMSQPHLIEYTLFFDSGSLKGE